MPFHNLQDIREIERLCRNSQKLFPCELFRQELVLFPVYLSLSLSHFANDHRQIPDAWHDARLIKSRELFRAIIPPFPLVFQSEEKRRCNDHRWKIFRHFPLQERKLAEINHCEEHSPIPIDPLDEALRERVDRWRANFKR